MQADMGLQGTRRHRWRKKATGFCVWRAVWSETPADSAIEGWVSYDNLDLTGRWSAQDRGLRGRPGV